MVCRLRVMILAAVIGLLFVAPTAIAGEIQQEALEAFHEGTVHYENNKWAEASVAFRRAFEISGVAVFVFNAARSAHQNENWRQAANYYERALGVEEEEKRLPEELRDRAERYLVEVRANLEASRIQEVEVRWAERGWLGTGVAATGAALVLSAGVLGVSASRGMEELRLIGDLEVYEEKLAEVKRTQQIGRAVLWGGGAIAATGIGLIIWELATVELREASQVGIVPTSNGVWAVWEVRF